MTWLKVVRVRLEVGSQYRLVEGHCRRDPSSPWKILGGEVLRLWGPGGYHWFRREQVL